MPHLRVTRDKRGYENTYVVHSVRRRGKSRQRILYWFRTPPNIRVGRTALDEEAIRVIEEKNPDIVFDWTKILEGQTAAPPAEQVERRRRPRDTTPSHVPSRVSEIPMSEGAAAADSVDQKPTDRPLVDRAAEFAPSTPPELGGSTSLAVDRSMLFTLDPELRRRADAELLRKDDSATSAAAPGESAPLSEISTPDLSEVAEIEPPALVPVTVYHGGADVFVAGEEGERRVAPVEARLGPDQLSRLRVRYAEILARITQRLGNDVVRLEEMRRSAELLNPDSWITESEIAAGVHQFDARVGEIRRALGIKRRRRSRRGGRRRRLARNPLIGAPAADSGKSATDIRTGDAADHDGDAPDISSESEELD